MRIEREVEAPRSRIAPPTRGAGTKLRHQAYKFFIGPIKRWAISKVDLIKIHKWNLIRANVYKGGPND